MDIFKHLKENKAALIAEKKYKVKHADSVFNSPISKGLIKEDGVIKSIELDNSVDLERINVSVVINTTNILDSHGDVHIKGIWNKSVKESKNVYLLQEHEMKFDKIIAENAKLSLNTMTWNELGFDYDGVTQALVFDCEVDSDRNKFMFEQYLKGYVKQHSVGMRYVNVFLCINSEEKYYLEEKENWDKYINEVANKEDAIELGYFWAVTEAKIIEGSAVVMGSNAATPTISISTTQVIEADTVTSSKEEPSLDTQAEKRKQFFINQLKN